MVGTCANTTCAEATGCIEARHTTTAAHRWTQLSNRTPIIFALDTELGQVVVHHFLYWRPAAEVEGRRLRQRDAIEEIPGAGQLNRILINKNLEELRREPLLQDLRRRIRDVKQGA
jgi:hypothetical protein